MQLTFKPGAHRAGAATLILILKTVDAEWAQEQETSSKLMRCWAVSGWWENPRLSLPFQPGKWISAGPGLEAA